MSGEERPLCVGCARLYGKRRQTERSTIAQVHAHLARRAITALFRVKAAGLKILQERDWPAARDRAPNAAPLGRG
jgi:hypothetical protein